MSRARSEGEQLDKMREQTLVLRLLKRLLGNISNDLEAQVGSLPIDRLEELGEALLDLTQMSDLIAWLDENI